MPHFRVSLLLALKVVSSAGDAAEEGHDKAAAPVRPFQTHAHLGPLSFVMSTLVAPVSNLHGTPSAELSSAMLGARSSVRRLLATVIAAAPNGRDYYPQGDNALRLAIKEFESGCDALSAIADDIFRLAETECQDVVPFVARAASVPENPSVVPTIHSNGSSPEFLRDSARQIFKDAQAAEEVFRSIVPNGRDYGMGEAWVAAREQHLDRVTTVRRIGGYYLQIAMACRKA